MWFFDWFDNQFTNIANWFNSTGSNISGVLYVGPSLSQPFYNASNFFRDLSTAAEYASSWADSVYNDAGTILNDIRGDLESWYPVLTASGSWFFDRVRTYAESYWSILTATSYTLFTRIQGYCTSTWAILADTRSSLWSYIRGQAESAYSILTASSAQLFERIRAECTSTWAILADTRSSLWSWISTSTLPGWVQSWFSGQSGPVISFVEAQIGYLLTRTFTFLGNNWPSFEDSFSWLQTKMISMTTARMPSFASLLWGAIEALLQNVNINR
jgi:hypothetical protein